MGGIMGLRRTTMFGLLVTVLAGCGGGSSGASSAPPTPPAVSMTIADRATLTKALPWQVTANALGNDLVSEVDFVVDGKKLWVEQSPPYFFDDDHQLLTPWLLGAGAHVLTAHVVTVNGATADATAHVTVRANLAANAAIAGTYARIVTAADQRRVASYRIPSKGAFGDELPTGKWTIVIKPNGEILTYDPGLNHSNPGVEPFTLSGSTMRLYGSAVWAQDNPGDASKFCEPEAASDYRVSTSGSSLMIANVEKACADRDILFVGTWTKR
jgi:hypothetical protein